MDEIYKRMQDDTENLESEDRGGSQIEQFYAGKNILLTGCTGYIGKCIVEKLLRTCSEIGTIYTVVRPKKQMSVQQRMDKYFSEIVFNKLRAKDPNFRKKVVPIESDLVKADLGLSQESRQLIIENVDIIIHNAASVYFYYNAATSVKINVLATQALLELAMECRKIKAFMYVSTAYSHSYLEKVIEEKFYSPPGDLKIIHDMIRVDEETKSGLTPEVVQDIIGQWPNIYTFGKAYAEHLVEQFGKKASFRCGVYRPSIVASTYKEPLACWTGNANGPVAAYLGTCLGIIRTMYIKGNPVVDVIPADMTVNALLIMIWDLAVYRKPKEPKVYNYGSGTLNPLRVSTVNNSLLGDGFKYPSVKSVWCYSMYFCSNYSMFLLLHFLMHFIPCLFADLYLILRRKKTFAVSMLMKLNQNLSWIIRFGNGNWQIQVGALKDIWTRMNHVDHEKFYTDVRVIDWYEYVIQYWKGIRVYVLKDSMDTLPAARKRYTRLRILHSATVWIMRLLAVYCIYTLVSYVFNF